MLTGGKVELFRRSLLGVRDLSDTLSIERSKSSIIILAFMRPGGSSRPAWEELTDSLHSDHFTIENLPARLGKLEKDPWADMANTKQSITAAMLKHLAGR